MNGTIKSVAFIHFFVLRFFVLRAIFYVKKSVEDVEQFPVAIVKLASTYRRNCRSNQYVFYKKKLIRIFESEWQHLVGMGVCAVVGKQIRDFVFFFYTRHFDQNQFWNAMNVKRITIGICNNVF
jgi:hypothetical protein